MWKKAKPNLRPTHPSIERARKVARLLDSAITIPFIRKKIGLDPLLGLLPIGGEVITGLMALYLIWVAYELRLPKSVLIRMGVNTLADILLGLVPVVGDISDFFWKSNDRNFQLLEAAYQQYGVGLRFDEWQGTSVIDVLVEPAAAAKS